MNLQDMQAWVRPALIAVAVFAALGAVFAYLFVHERSRQRTLRSEHLKLSKIIEASGLILKTLRREDAINAVLNLCPQLVDAAAYAVWRKDRETGKWFLVKSMGLSDRYVQSMVERLSHALDKKASLKGPVIVDDVTRPSWFSEAVDTYREEGIRSLLVCPLEFHAEPIGTLVFYGREGKKFSASDLRIAGAVASLAANAINSSDLYEERSDMLNREIAENRRTAFLAEVGVVIGASLNYRKTLESVAFMAVPEIADWCVVDMRNDMGELETLAISHVDPQKIESARRFRKLMPARSEGESTLAAVLKSGNSQLIPKISPAMIESIEDKDEREFIDSLGLSSIMMVPVRVRDKTLGVISFVQAESGRHFTESDLSLGEDLARRAALSIDNAGLYDKARTALEAREAAVGKLQKQINQQAVLTAVSQRWLSRIDPHTLLDDTVFWLANTLKATYCLVVKSLSETRTFDIQALSGWEKKEVSHFTEDFATAEFFRDIERSDTPFFFEARDERLRNFPLFKAFDLSSGIIVQIKTPDSHYGFVAVFSRNTVAFSQDDIHFIQSVANVIAASVDRLDAEKALEASERKYRQLFDLSPDGILVTDGDYKITTANPEALRIFGSAAAGLVGGDVLRLATPEQAEQMRDLIRQTLRMGLSRDEEITLRRNDGTPFSAEISAASIQDDDGDPLTFFCIVRDITQRKELEELKNDFIATVSHELRTPLTSIYVSLELMAKGRLIIGGDEYRNLIDVAHKNCERLIHLINDFLDLQKIELNKVVFDMEESDIAELVEQGVSMNRVYAEHRDVRFLVERPRHGILVNLDPERFLQVLTNLLSNAVKFSPAGAKVMIAHHYRRGRVRVSVINYGPAIPQEYRDKLFNKFVQVDASLHRKHDGTGLGLAISKGIVEGMGGTIGFKSDEAFTEFFVDFPARTARKEPAAAS